MKFVHQIPNMITLGNLLLGCLAIVYLFNDHMLIEVNRREVQAEMGLIHISCFLVFLAAIVDFFDGFVARILRAESPIGGELDSLSDMVCFGLVPGLIMYQLIAKSFYTGTEAFSIPILLFSAGFLITLFAAIRLAKFNLDEEDRGGGFMGVPTPSIAMFVASLPLIQLSDQTGVGAFLNDKWVLLALTVVLSYLMVAPLPMLSMKIKKLDWAVYKWQIGGILSGLAIFLICIFAGLKYLAVPISFLYYLVLSIAHNITSNGVQGSN